MSATAATPGGLDLVAEFVNTLDVDDGTDELSTAGGLQDWLSDHDLLPSGAEVSDHDAERAREVREAIRSLLWANNGEPVDKAAVAKLNASAAGAHLRVQFADDGGSELVPDESGAPGALGLILGLTYTAMADDTWSRLKVCREHTCQWAFYDHSKNRSRTWCSMRVCGNRTKARAYRSRRRG
jgi:predicted RNA-binding Zn ribbon-like protein